MFIQDNRFSAIQLSAIMDTFCDLFCPKWQPLPFLLSGYKPLVSTRQMNVASLNENRLKCDQILININLKWINSMQLLTIVLEEIQWTLPTPNWSKVSYVFYSFYLYIAVFWLYLFICSSRNHNRCRGIKPGSTMCQASALRIVHISSSCFISFKKKRYRCSFMPI